MERIEQQARIQAAITPQHIQPLVARMLGFGDVVINITETLLATSEVTEPFEFMASVRDALLEQVIVSRTALRQAREDYMHTMTAHAPRPRYRRAESRRSYGV
jgi:hypothetical protein